METFAWPASMPVSASSTKVALLLPGAGYKKTIVAGGEVIGTWARQGTSPGAAVVPELFDGSTPLGAGAQAAFNKAAEQYQAFLAG